MSLKHIVRITDKIHKHQKQSVVFLKNFNFIKKWKTEAKKENHGGTEMLPSPYLLAEHLSLFWTVGVLVLAWSWSGPAAVLRPGEYPAAWKAPTQHITKRFFFPRYRCLFKHDKTLWGHHDGRSLHLLTDSFLVLELLLQGSFAAFSVVPLTAHLLSHLFELLLNCWTLTTRRP